MFTYEEIRVAVVDVLLGHGDFQPYGQPNQWGALTLAVARALSPQTHRTGVGIYQAPYLQDPDAELTRDVFWDLFRQGYITLGINDSNPGWPFFRLSRFGAKALQEGQPLMFTDTTSYIKLMREQIVEIDSLTVRYLEESVQSFYAGCLLAAAVMLGVAAENLFLNFLNSIARVPKHTHRFKAAFEAKTILRKIIEFQKRLPGDVERMPASLREDLDSHFSTVQAVIRSSRNEAGHPTGNTPSREQVYVNLQLFAPFGRKLSLLKAFYTSVHEAVD